MLSEEPYLIDRTELRSSVWRYLALDTLLVALRERALEEEQASAQGRLLSQLQGHLVAVAANVSAEVLQDALRLWGTERILINNDFVLFDESLHHASHFVLLIDRMTVHDLSHVQTLRARAAAVHESSLATGSVLYVKQEQGWQLVPHESPASTVTFEHCEDESLGDFFTKLFAATELELFEHFLSHVRRSSTFHLQTAAKLSTLPWKVLHNLSLLRRCLMTKDEPAYLTITEVKKPIVRPMDIYLPHDVIGSGKLADFLELKTILQQFFKALPETSRGLYRGHSRDEFLAMTLGECLCCFKNHPKCRALGQLVDRLGLGQLSLVSKLEDYSYETAFLIALVRELRKLREEVTIYIPQYIWSETGTALSSILKETIEAQLQFYRAKIIVLEHE